MKKFLFCTLLLSAFSVTASAAPIEAKHFAGAFQHPHVTLQVCNKNAPSAPCTWFEGGEPMDLLEGTLIAASEATVPAGQIGGPTHSVTATWQDTQNPAGTTYSVYRAQGLCSGTPTFAKLATGVATKTYTDSTVTPGNYCYQVTATAGGVESAPSNSSLASVPSFSPTSLALTVQ